MVTLNYIAKAHNARLIELPAETEAQLGLKPGDEIEISIPRVSQSPSTDREATRIAAIDAAMGSMTYLGVTSDDLRRERQADDALAERQLQGDRA